MSNYGTSVKAIELINLLKHLFQIKPATPICIWGKHGIGKTEIVQTLAKDLEYHFAYIAPAQFEEMGDLLGMPTIEDGQTVFRAPEWVPKQTGPGILLIDDVNRADDRILRGIMQLLQQQALVSWKLPPNWQIILTANPEGGDYSVTPMDEAMLTRMMHVTLEFDLTNWIEWAQDSGIDDRIINFVLTHPETITGQRTTPRTLVQFNNTIQHLAPLYDHLELIQILGDSCLDEDTVSTFISFINQRFEQLPSPETILTSENFTQEIAQPIYKIVHQSTLRVDILYTLFTRLSSYLKSNSSINNLMINNLKAFLQLDFIPNDLRFNFAREVVGLPHPKLKALFSDPVVGQLLLDEM